MLLHDCRAWWRERAALLAAGALKADHITVPYRGVPPTCQK